MILKYGRDSIARLKRTGIDIDERQYQVVEQQILDLTVPHEVCMRSPHWDPFVLEVMFQDINTGVPFTLPNTPFDQNVIGLMMSAMQRLMRIAPYYYDRYLGERNEKRIYSIVLTAMRWAQEKPLKDVIGWGESVDPKKIDSRLHDLNKAVAFDLPKLLRPLFNMKDPANPLLTEIEMGAYKPAPRRLIELGLARETAIRLLEPLGDPNAFMSADETIDDNLLMSRIRAVYETLSYWERIQVSPLLL